VAAKVRAALIFFSTVSHSSFCRRRMFTPFCSTCGANELLYWKMPAGTLAGRARDMADVEWVRVTVLPLALLRFVTPVAGVVHCNVGLGCAGEKMQIMHFV